MSLNLPNPSLRGILLVVSGHGGPQLVFSYPKELSEWKQKSNLSNFNDVYDSSYDSTDEGTDDDQLNDAEGIWDSKSMNHYLGKRNTGKMTMLENDKDKFQEESLKSSDSSTKKKFLDKENTLKTICGIEQDYLVEMLCPSKLMCNARFDLAIDELIFLGLPIHKYDNGSWRASSKEKDSVEQSSLNMFHLVFIMNPPVIECNFRVDEMFHYVISRLSLVLRYEQLKSNFVAREVKSIMNLKEKFKDDNLYGNLIQNSSLCKIISDCYNAISESKIANLSIENKLRSFQIPIKTEFHSLPETSVPYIPGSYLSSTVKLLEHSGLINVGSTTRYETGNMTNMYQLNELDDSGTAADDLIYFALLLLDDPDSIISDIKTEHDSTLANFIRTIRPTESLLKLSIRNSDLNIQQIKSFAFHLIYWRRARVIQPLNTRSVYILSPMAPISVNLHEDILRFKNQFPSLPSLSHFLKLFSSPSKKPKQFASIIPSKDHKDSYINALSWLFRYGYVTQLQTFIWLKIPKKIKIKVEEDLENEAQTKKRSKSSNKIETGTDNTFKEDKDHKTIEQDIEIMEKSLRTKLNGPNISLDDEDDTIIIDPGRASTLERKWISKIIDERKLSKELTAIFYKLLKYLNGKNSLELLMLKENISRTELRKLLFEIEEFIISVRHW